MSRGFYSPCVYTRRQSSDIFQNDPFKTQSYNFRYAERPAYPVQNYQRPPPKQPEAPPFKTYYYNAKFNMKSETTAAPPPTSSFVEARRRQFLQEVRAPTRIAGLKMPEQGRKAPQLRTTPAITTHAPNRPLLTTCYNREDYRGIGRGQSVTTFTQSASVSRFKQPERSPSQTTFKFAPRRSASCCSGCAININIRGVDSKTDLDKSLRIKIETDACLHNNTNQHRVQTPRNDHGQAQAQRQDTQRSSVIRSGSSESFVIDKRLSKFSITDASWARKRSTEQDERIAKRMQMQLERDRVEKLRQEELKREQERARQREKERERLRAAEMQRDRERLLELEAEREKQRLRELERQEQRKREIERRYEEQLRLERQQRMPMRAMSMPSANSAPLAMTSHLYTPASCDRLPGMAPCYVQQPAASSKVETSRAERLQRCTRRLATLSAAAQPSPTAPRCLERRSSNTSNYNASVPGGGSNSNMQQLSATHLKERKLLNLHVNGIPVSSSQPIHARINNMPIRITTSRPTDEHLQFSVNRVRVANASPMARTTGNAMAATAQNRSSTRSRSNSRSGLQEPTTIPCNVNINVFADNPSTLHL